MTYLMGEEKPSLKETLEHHGVKGMKWGVSKNDGTTGRRRASTQEILDARATHAARWQKIMAADQDVRLATNKKGKDAALKVVEKYAKQIHNTDDARVANMYTKGERVANTIVLGPIGLALNRHNTKATSEDRFH